MSVNARPCLQGSAQAFHPRIMALDPTVSNFLSGWQYTSEDKQLVISPDSRFFHAQSQPPDAFALFTRLDGHQPRNFNHGNHLGHPNYVWREEEIQAKANHYILLLQQSHMGSQGLLPVPFRWEDLFWFFDQRDIYFMGAWNAWRVVLRAVNMQRVLTGVLDRVRPWTANWLMWPQNQEALERWDGQVDILNVISQEDWVEGGMNRCAELDLVQIRCELHWYRGLRVSHFHESGFKPIQDGRLRTNALLPEESVFSWMYRTEHHDDWVPQHVPTWRDVPPPADEPLTNNDDEDKATSGTVAIGQSATVPSSPTQEIFHLTVPVQTKAASTPASPTIEHIELVSSPTAERVEPSSETETNIVIKELEQKPSCPPVISSNPDKNGSYLWTPQNAAEGREEQESAAHKEKSEENETLASPSIPAPAQVPVVPTVKITATRNKRTYPAPGKHLQNRRGYGAVFTPEDFQPPDHPMQWPSIVHRAHMKQLGADYSHFARIYAGYSEEDEYASGQPAEILTSATQHNDDSANEAQTKKAADLKVKLSPVEPQHHKVPFPVVASQAISIIPSAVVVPGPLATPTFAPAVQPGQSPPVVPRMTSKPDAALEHAHTAVNQPQASLTGNQVSPHPVAEAERRVATTSAANLGKDPTKNTANNRNNSARGRKDGSDNGNGRTHWTHSRVDVLHGPVVRHEPQSQRTGSFTSEARHQQPRVPTHRQTQFGVSNCINEPLVERHGVFIKYAPCPCKRCDLRSRSIFIVSLSVQKASEDEARELLTGYFSEFGEIEGVTLRGLLDPSVPHRKAFIHFKDEASAIRAVVERREMDLPPLTGGTHSVRAEFPHWSKHYTPPNPHWSKNYAPGSRAPAPQRRSSLLTSSSEQEMTMVRGPGNPGGMPPTPIRKTPTKMEHNNTMGTPTRRVPPSRHSSMIVEAGSVTPSSSLGVSTIQRKHRTITAVHIGSMRTPTMGTVQAMHPEQRTPQGGFPQGPVQQHGPYQPGFYHDPAMNPFMGHQVQQPNSQPIAPQHVLGVGHGQPLQFGVFPPGHNGNPHFVQTPPFANQLPVQGFPPVGPAPAYQSQAIRAHPVPQQWGPPPPPPPPPAMHQIVNRRLSQAAASEHSQQSPLLQDPAILSQRPVAMGLAPQQPAQTDAARDGAPLQAEKTDSDVATQDAFVGYITKGEPVMFAPVAGRPDEPQDVPKPEVQIAQENVPPVAESETAKSLEPAGATNESTEDSRPEQNKNDEQTGAVDEQFGTVIHRKLAAEARHLPSAWLKPESPEMEQQSTGIMESGTHNGVVAVGLSGNEDAKDSSTLIQGHDGTVDQLLEVVAHAEAPKKKESKAKNKKTVKAIPSSDSLEVQSATGANSEASTRASTPAPDPNGSLAPKKKKNNKNKNKKKPQHEAGVSHASTSTTKLTGEPSNDVPTNAVEEPHKGVPEDTSDLKVGKTRNKGKNMKIDTKSAQDYFSTKLVADDLTGGSSAVDTATTKPTPATAATSTYTSPFKDQKNEIEQAKTKLSTTSKVSSTHRRPRMTTAELLVNPNGNFTHLPRNFLPFPRIVTQDIASPSAVDAGKKGIAQISSTKGLELEPPLTAATTHSRVSSTGYFTAESQPSTPPSDERREQDEAEVCGPEPEEQGSPTPRARKSKTGLSKLNPQAKEFSSPADSPVAASFQKWSVASPYTPQEDGKDTTNSSLTNSGPENRGRSPTKSPPSSDSDESKKKGILRRISETPSPKSKIVTWQEKVGVRTTVGVDDDGEALFVDGQQDIQHIPPPPLAKPKKRTGKASTASAAKAEETKEKISESSSTASAKVEETEKITSA